jgi:hypothetical protein
MPISPMAKAPYMEGASTFRLFTLDVGLLSAMGGLSGKTLLEKDF